MGKAFFKTGQDIESCFFISFRYTDGTGQLNFGFAADAIANNDHFLPLGLGSQYNGTVSLLSILPWCPRELLYEKLRDA